MHKHFIAHASAARTATGNSGEFIFDDPNSLAMARFTLDITAVSGTTPTLVLTVEAFDPASGKYVTVLASASQNATGTIVLAVGPGLPVTANLSANAPMPRQFRIKWTIGGTTPSFTFSVGVDQA